MEDCIRMKVGTDAFRKLKFPFSEIFYQVMDLIGICDEEAYCNYAVSY